MSGMVDTSPFLPIRNIIFLAFAGEQNPGLLESEGNALCGEHEWK